MCTVIQRRGLGREAPASEFSVAAARSPSPSGVEGASGGRS